MSLVVLVKVVVVIVVVVVVVVVDLYPILEYNTNYITTYDRMK